MLEIRLFFVMSTPSKRMLRPSGYRLDTAVLEASRVVLTARAFDAAGNEGVSPPVVIRVSDSAAGGGNLKGNGKRK